MSSSSFPAARFPALPISKEREAADTAYIKDTLAPTADPSDEALLTRICADDKEALGLLFRRYARLVHSIGKKILRDPGEAEDFVQEFFLHIYKKAHIYNEFRGPARGWIVQTCYFHALRRRIRLSTRPHYGSAEFDEMNAGEVVAPPTNGYDQSGEGLFGKVRWKELIASLTEDQWETLRMHFYEGYTFAEIAALRNQTTVSVRHHFYRGLDRLRKHISSSELHDR
jgi:RNA polymerase sigma-70 factor (ECF subfamily)